MCPRGAPAPAPQCRPVCPLHPVPSGSQDEAPEGHLICGAGRDRVPNRRCYWTLKQDEPLLLKMNRMCPQINTPQFSPHIHLITQGRELVRGPEKCTPLAPAPPPCATQNLSAPGSLNKDHRRTARPAHLGSESPWASVASWL